MESKVDSLISLKVHRIVPRNDEAICHFLTPNELVAFFTLDEELEADEKALPPEYSEEWRYLPKLYGQVYLGETFSFHIKASNESASEEITQVTVRSDLQLYSNRVVTLGEGKKDRLQGKEFVHQVYQHEIKELGNHVLIVTVSYKIADSVDALVFRRFFKFRVEKPLDVKTKFYNAESDEVYLEALLQNLTNLPMCLDSVKLEPSSYFDVKSMNKVTTREGSQEWVFGRVNRFSPNEFRQYLFCLNPKEEYRNNVKLLKNVTFIGKLDIMWTSGIGCKGHLQTSQLERMSPNCSDIRLTVIKIPSEVELKKKFHFVFKVTNCCDYPIEPFLHFDNLAKDQSILWLGISGKSLGELKPADSIDIKLTAYPIRPGLCAIPCLRLSDPHLQVNYSFEEVAYVFVNEGLDASHKSTTTCLNSNSNSSSNNNNNNGSLSH